MLRKNDKYKRVLGVLVFSCILAVSAFGQSWTYSDSWVDEPVDPDANTQFTDFYIVSFGYAILDTTKTVHDAKATITLQSPTGHITTFEETNFSGGGTSVMTSQQFNEFEVGNFTTTTTVEEICPYNPVIYQSGDSMAISIKREVYVLIGDIPVGGRYGYGFCEYDNYCPFGLGICGLQEFSVDRYQAHAVCPGTIQCRTLYVRGACLNRAKVCTGIPPNTGTCDYN